MNYCYFIFLITAGLCYGEIRQIDSLVPLEQEISFCDQKTLILLDIGGTLIQSPDALMHITYLPWINDWYKRNYPNLSQEDKNVLIRILQNDPKIWELTDPKWLEIIPEARKIGAKVVAFTKVVFPSSKGARAKKLRSYGLSIQDDLPMLSSGTLYEYQDGIIETESVLKGPVLAEVLKNLPVRPEKIIFVDDREEQINSVDQLCSELGISCIAFYYVATHPAPFLDEEIANLQMSTLVSTHQWISDRDAKNLIQK